MAVLSPELLEYAELPVEKKIGELIIKGQSPTKIARKFRIQKSEVDDAIQRIKFNAAKRGYSPDHECDQPLPPTQILNGVTNLYKVNEDGSKTLRMQYVKSKRGPEDRIEEVIQEFAKGIATGVKGTIKPTQFKGGKQNDKEMACYVIGDQHLGLLSWAAETGGNYDLKIGMRDLHAASTYLIEQTPPVKHAMLLSVGDFLHSNDKKGQTPGSGNNLDVDGRFGRIVRYSGRALRLLIANLLTKHEKVSVLLARGNHDPDATIWLREIVQTAYENEPRVGVAFSDRKVLTHEFGQVSLFTHHGEVGFKRLHEYITGHYRPLLGRTKYSYCFTGHIHHEKVHEIGGIKFRSFNPLCENDAWHADNAYGANKMMSVVKFHQDWGRLGEIACPRDLARSTKTWESNLFDDVNWE